MVEHPRGLRASNLENSCFFTRACHQAAKDVQDPAPESFEIKPQSLSNLKQVSRWHLDRIDAVCRLRRAAKGAGTS